MIIFLLLLAVLFAISLPQSRITFGFAVAVVFLAIAGNIDNPDRYYYVENYAGILYDMQDVSFEVGYQAFAYLASKIGLDYFWFHLILTSIACFLISITILRYSSQPSLVVVAYLFFPFFWDVTQVRNFYAMSIIIFGMRYLIDDQERSFLKYVISIILASSFHFTSVFYLLFLSIHIRNKAVFIAFVCAFASIFYGLFSIIAGTPYLAFIADKIDVYTTTETSGTTKILVMMFYLASLGILYIASKITPQIPNTNVSTSTSESTIKKCVEDTKLVLSSTINTGLLLRINIVAGISILLTLNNLDFIRLYRNVFIINSIFVFNGIFFLRPFLSRLAFTLLFFAYLITVFYGFVYMSSTSNIIESTLYENIISF